MNNILIQDLAEMANIKFGTSGLRGLVSDLTDEVCFAYTKAFLQSQNPNEKVVAIGHDLRPSSPEIANACNAAAESLGYECQYIGALPTPALAYYCLENNIPGIMVTGSHIPFDRNGIKFYRADGEISKHDEHTIMQSSIELPSSKLSVELPPLNNLAITLYKDRYINFFGKNFLSEKTIAIYQHSSVARDFLNDIFTALGAKTILLGRSDTFIPIDTEAVRNEDIKQFKKWADEYNFDVLVSTDGDADRPLITDETGEFIRGDILGILTAQYLKADHVVTPISSNTAVELSNSFKSVTRTKIGSPYVIQGMLECKQNNPNEIILGYEANGGFLIQTDINHGSLRLNKLPTRDALLPILSTLGMSIDYRCKISKLVTTLPKRFTDSGRIRNLPANKSKRIFEFVSQNPENIYQFYFDGSAKIINIDWTDGMRVTFGDGNIIHIRQSGNAPELRCYCETNNATNEKKLVEQCISSIKDFVF